MNQRCNALVNYLAITFEGSLYSINIKENLLLIIKDPLQYFQVRNQQKQNPIPMGQQTSFITNYCTEVEFQLNYQNLLSFGYQRAEQQLAESHTNQGSISSLYRSVYSGKFYTLQTWTDRTDLIERAKRNIERLHYGSFKSLTSIQKFSVSQTKYKFGNSTRQLKVLTESYRDDQRMLHPNMDENKTDIQICEVLKSFTSIIEQLLVLGQDSNLFVQADEIYKTQSRGIKYKPNWKSLTIKSLQERSYFSPQLFQGLSLQTDRQKSLVFSFGMALLHYLLGKQCFECYYMRQRQFCSSQLQKSLQELHLLMQSRFLEKFNNISQANDLSPKTHKSYSADDSFEMILYQGVFRMLNGQTNRASLGQTKKVLQKLLSKVTGSVMGKNDTQTFCVKLPNTQNSLEYVRKQPHSMHSTQDDTALNIQKCRFRQIAVDSDSSNSDYLNESQDKMFPVIKRRENGKSRRIEGDKQNIQDNSFQRVLYGLKGLQKVEFRDQNTGIVSGYFNGQRAQGLGKLLKQNGEIEECIFDNDEMIAPIQNIRN